MFSSRRTKNLTQKLISEVHARPMLWDRHDDFYNNRGYTEREWSRLSVTIGKNKDFLRQRWKNLRDQFHKELKKIVIPPGGATKSLLEYYTGRWAYFEQLMFIKDSFKKKKESSLSFFEEDDEDIKEEMIEIDEQPMSYNNDKNPLDLQQFGVKFVTYQESGEHLEKVRERDEHTRERKDMDNSENSQERLNCKTLPMESSAEEIDDDLHFVKSLVPFFRKLTPVKKLLVRNEIQNILIKANLCDTCGGNTCHNTE